MCRAMSADRFTIPTHPMLANGTNGSTGALVHREPSGGTSRQLVNVIDIVMEPPNLAALSLEFASDARYFRSAVLRTTTGDVIGDSRSRCQPSGVYSNIPMPDCSWC